MTAFGIVLALVQGLWAIGWVVYVVWLPGLVQQAGMLADWVPWLLILDQWVFALSDLVCGVAADRLRRQLRRFGPWLMAMMGLSALAFLLLPWAARSQAPTLFLVLTLVWTATSSALRAPVMALLGRHVSAQQLAWPTGLWLFGLGVAGALAPYLQPRVRELSPDLAFALPAVALMLAASALIWAERQLGHTESSPAPTPSSAPVPLWAARPRIVGLPGWGLFLGAVALAALGFQIHFPVNAAPQFLQLNPSATLETLLPLFWVGFNLALWPASRLSQRLGGVGTMAVGCTVAAWASAAGAASDTLPALIACQVLAGAAWACVLLSASSAATNAGRTGYEGLASGGCFALLALAAMARMTMAAGQGFQHPGVVPWLNVAPAFSWMLAAGLLLVLWRRQRCERGA
jgi:MFS family permease